MSETILIMETVASILLDEELIRSNSIRDVAMYFNLSHTALYKMIKQDRISIKFYKLIKVDEKLKHINISESYIINNILMGL